MLRFGGLKYKKLNNAAFCGESPNKATTGTPNKPDGKLEKTSSSPGTATPGQERLHNHLSGAAMKNVNKRCNLSELRRAGNNNMMLLASGLPGKTYPDTNSSKPPLPVAHTSTQPRSLSSSFKLLGGKFTIDSKRKNTCKTRIYKCIKRILKRNSLGGVSNDDKPGQQLEHLGSNRQRVPALHSPHVDYREIRTILHKQNRELEYDVNLAKCVEKPAFIKKITLNFLQTTVTDSKDESALVLKRDQASAVTCSIRHDLDRDQEYQRLLGECWYHENLPRNLSLGLLVHKLPGSFLVRKSTTQPDCYALSLRVPPGSGTRIAHYLIVRTASDGYKIKGFRKEFSSLRALIVHHSVMPEALPITLALPRPGNLVVKTKFDDDYEAVFDLADAGQRQK